MCLCTILSKYAGSGSKSAHILNLRTR